MHSTFSEFYFTFKQFLYFFEGQYLIAFLPIYNLSSG